MQTVSKVLVGIVLACLLLSCVSSVQRSLHRAHSNNRSGRERHRALVRLRRCRGDNPVHHPVRPCKNAMLPPDDDDDDDDNIDQKHPYAKGSNERLPILCQDPAYRSLSPAFGSRPLPTQVPRHQTLCILLI
ncbi:MAG TPA: hypothetical protein VMF69_29000 [Gemmataceae bacterium]|nr:hypothetical protein [Gemmataceae bacterium]